MKPRGFQHNDQVNGGKLQQDSLLSMPAVDMIFGREPLRNGLGSSTCKTNTCISDSELMRGTCTKRQTRNEHNRLIMGGDAVNRSFVELMGVFQIIQGAERVDTR